MCSLVLFRMGHFGGSSRMGEDGKRPLTLKICHTYLAMTKLGPVILYLKTIQKVYESRASPLKFC